jgi:hypothetical protein
MSCGGARLPPVAARPIEPLIVLRGTVTFDARCATPQGASAQCEVRPARYVGVRVLGRDGGTIADGRTDGDGELAIEAPASAAFLEIRAQTDEGGIDVAVSRDAAGARVHDLQVEIEDPSTTIDVHARDQDGTLAGALHLLDTMRRGLEAVRGWTGRTLPPVYAYWDRGVTREWSYYRGERPAGSGRFCVELLGGDPGEQTTTDTDEHDEAIVLHELGHFVMDRLSGDSSLGGMHPRGALIDPGLAWEEGRATWFATAVLGAPPYRDTIGLEPHGSLRVDESLESPRGPRGIGSETSVAGVLWDLADGIPAPGADSIPTAAAAAFDTLPDTDQDALAIGPEGVLRAMIALEDVDGSFASLPTFLRFLVDTGRVPERDLRAMLSHTGEPSAVLPASATPVWPRDLVFGTWATAKIDGLTQPAPSGGPNRPDTGIDAIHAYRVRASRRGMLSVRVAIRGTGRPADHSDIDVELRDRRARILDAARGTSAIESVARIVEPGWYIVYVRDGGGGNRADYRLDVTLDPV